MDIQFTNIKVANSKDLALYVAPHFEAGASTVSADYSSASGSIPTSGGDANSLVGMVLLFILLMTAMLLGKKIRGKYKDFEIEIGKRLLAWAKPQPR